MDREGERREGIIPVGQDTAPVAPGKGGIFWVPPDEPKSISGARHCLGSSFLATASNSAASPLVGLR